ncbi:hypothetical protein GS528_27750 [Rhodococcus hoagii]|nr:hypothetical protein [Prescottella equi]
MLDLGLSQTAVAKAASVSRDKVKTLATVGASKALAPAWTSISSPSNRPRPSPSSKEAGDTEGNRLLSYGSHYQFDYMAERLRRDRVERIAHAEAAAPYEAKGFTILDGYKLPPGSRRSSTCSPTPANRSPSRRSKLTPPAGASGMSLDRGVVRPPDRGEEVAEDEIDGTPHDNPDLEAEDGLIHMNSIETCRVWDREFHLLDPGTSRAAASS